MALVAPPVKVTATLLTNPFSTKGLNPVMFVLPSTKKLMSLPVGSVSSNKDTKTVRPLSGTGSLKLKFQLSWAHSSNVVGSVEKLILGRAKI